MSRRKRWKNKLKVSDQLRAKLDQSFVPDPSPMEAEIAAREARDRLAMISLRAKLSAEDEALFKDQVKRMRNKFVIPVTHGKDLVFTIPGHLMKRKRPGRRVARRAAGR